MSQSQMDVIRRSFERWEAGDVEGSVRDVRPDIVVVAPEGWPEGPVIEGVEAWRRQLDRLRADWEEAKVEIEALRPVGADAIVARIRYVTRGPGMSFDTPMSVAYLFADDQIVRIHYCWEHEAAVEAATAGTND